MGNETDASGADHAHRWRIEAQGGPTSVGSCACGAEKQFSNSWDREASAWALARGRGSRNASGLRE